MGLRNTTASLLKLVSVICVSFFIATGCSSGGGDGGGSGTASSGAVSANAASDTFNITATSGANGTVSPSGVTAVKNGSDQTYTITANAGYDIAEIKVDGKAVLSAGTSPKVIYTYDFTSVAADHTLSASFGPTGQDGDQQLGVVGPAARFTNNGDGTVTDHLTGLRWLVNANCLGNQEKGLDQDGTENDGAVTWQHALDYVAALNAGTDTCGGAASAYHDWRLPTIQELRSLIDYSQYNPALPKGNPFSGLVVSGNYWSATSYAGNPDGAWLVGFYGGIGSWVDKGSTYYVWPVRAGK